jgi:UDP-glucose 4-epimerase
MEENEEDFKLLIRKMMKDSGRIARRSPIFKKDIKDFDGIAKVQWNFAGTYAYQIYETDNYTFNIGEKIEDPDVAIRILNPELATKFLKGEDMGLNVASRRDYKGRFKLEYVAGHKEVETHRGKKKQRIVQRYLTARAFNDKFVHPYNLLKLPPFQRSIKMDEIGKKEEYGVYVPINQSLGTYEDKVIPYKVFEHFIERTSNIILVNTCGCRAFHDCKNHDHSLGCMYMGDETIPLLETEEHKFKIWDHQGTSVTKEEALERVRRAIDDGLIPLLGRSIGEASSYGIKDEGHFLSCCFCCSCCCVNGRAVTQGPNVKMNQLARIDGISVSVDEDLCIGCSKCVEVCVFKGREMVNEKAKIDQERCLGCGRCAEVCPTGATTIDIDDMTVVDDLIGKIEKFVDVRDQKALAD